MTIYNMLRVNAAVLTYIAATLLLFCVDANANDNRIYIDNYICGDSQSYPVAIIKGRVQNTGSETIVIENLSSSRGLRISRNAVIDGSFKALIELTPGENRLFVTSGATKLDFCLYYIQRTSRYFVRLVLFVDSLGRPLFQNPLQHDSYIDVNMLAQKLRVAGLLWQCATAESFYLSNLGRRTFSLEFDEAENVVVWIQRGEKTAEEYATLSNRERFQQIYREIMLGNAGSAFARYFVLLALPQTNENDNCVRNRLALGGGNIGMLDASIFFACPESLDEVSSRFCDTRAIPEQYWKDTAYRNAVWALVASSLGAGLHELGHAFDLDHVETSDDYMSRGFDKFNRVFSMIEPSLLNPEEVQAFSQDDCSRWGKMSTARLLHSPWIGE